jgi:two-component system phosphate regulon sensor histidine kinase PhoR
LETLERKLRSLSEGVYSTSPAAKKRKPDEIDRIADKIDEVAAMIRKVIDDLNDEKTRREEFFTNASHELKTPLTAIKGFNELILINNKDEKIHKFASSTTRETERMLVLIGDMLKISELENDATRVMNRVPVPLSLIIAEVRDNVSAAVAEKQLDFTVSNAVGAVVHAEQSHVYDIVKNLIENAVRYNNRGGKVDVTVRKTNDCIRLTVADTGIGIPDKDKARVFERFFCVEKGRSRQSGGTGLGLSIIKHICALYEWDLSLKSEVGVGTEITVEFAKWKSN